MLVRKQKLDGFETRFSGGLEPIEASEGADVFAREGAAVSAELGGNELLQALMAVPSETYLVVDPSGQRVGVLAASDVEAALSHD